MTWLPLIFKFRDVAYLAVIGLAWLWIDHLDGAIARDKLAQSEALRKAQEKSEAISNELIIQQAIAMSKTNQKETDYGNRIRNAPAPATGRPDLRWSIGNRGVRDILSGESGETK